MLQFRRDYLSVSTDERLFSIVAHHPTKPHIKDVIRAFNAEGAVDIFMSKHMDFYDLNTDLQPLDAMIAIEELNTLILSGAAVENGV